MLIGLLSADKLLSQNVAINADGTAPHASAMLDIKSTTKGLLIPRMTTLQRTTIPAPALGLKVFDINTGSFHFYNGIKWVEMASVSTTNYWMPSGTNIYNNTGYVGIGISTPSSRLHIVGNEASVPLRIQNKLVSGYTGMHFHNYAGTLMGHMGYANISAPTFANSFYAGSIAAVPFIFTTSNIERMRIANTGYVGIGTIAPTSRLHIIGNEASVPLRIQNNLVSGYTGMHFHNSTGALMGHMGFANISAPTFSNSFYAGSIGNAPFILTTNNLERIRINSTGNIGIGTTGIAPHPSAMLEIKSSNKGLLVPRMSMAQRNLIATPAASLLIYQTDNTPGYYYYNGTGWVQLATGGGGNSWSPNGNMIFSNNAGNVGIGTSNPADKLTVQSAYDAYGITHTDGNIKISTYIGKGGHAWFGTQSNHSLHIYTNAQGTPNITFHPGFYTDIRGKKPWLRFYDETNGYNLSGDIRSNGSNLEIAAYKAGNVVVGSTPGNLILQADDPRGLISLGAAAGNVGIGVSNPAFKLDVGNRIRLRSQGSDDVTAGIWFNNYTNTQYTGFIGETGRGAPNHLGIYGITSGWSFVMNTVTGNVGIGKFNPANKLDVNGTVRATEIIVESGWADYVFNDDYKLPSLNEVEKFIQQNHHLPNMPSAKEVKEKGLYVGDTQRRMMEKIEELTLYVIEMKKEIEMLKKNCGK